MLDEATEPWGIKVERDEQGVLDEGESNDDGELGGQPDGGAGGRDEEGKPGREPRDWVVVVEGEEE